MKYPQTLVAACVFATILSACSDDSTLPTGDTVDPADGSDLDARLKPFDTSEEFYQALRDALINQGGQQNEELAIPVSLPATEPAPGAPVADNESADSSASAGESQQGGTGNEVTSTNVQEVGVDEQDRVKISLDGSKLYVLSSGYSYGPVTIDNELGEEDLIIEPGIADTSMPAPQNLETVMRVMAVDPNTPDTQSLAEISVDLQGRYADGFYLYENGANTTALLTSSGGGYWDNWGESVAFAGLNSELTKINLTDPSAANVEASFQLDGQIVSSRRIGKHLFFASRYYPAIPGDQPWAQSAEQWTDTVNTTDLATLMPQYRNSDTGDITPLANAAECFVARTDADQPYYSPDIITLGAIDLDTMQLTDSQCFLGSTETLYASTEAVYLATTQYDYFEGPMTDAGSPVDVDNIDLMVDEPWVDPRVETDIHQFDIDNGNLVYAGSGSVRGHLGWNQLRKPFRMSERNGYLRIATMNDQQGPDHSPILVSVLQADGQGNLQRVSTLPNESRPAFIGKPGEQLYASRFVGDRAYLVTFRQTDPFYVIDLADPTDIAMLGELEIQGYNDFLHAIDANYVVGLGSDAVAAPNSFDGGAMVQGLKLSLFDVSNPSAPTEVQSVLIGQRGTHSVASYNHRAITIQAATQDHPTRISFGVNVHGDAQPASSPSPDNAFTYYDWSYTGLHGFDVQIGPGAGIEPRGAMVVESSANGVNQYGPMYGDDRSVMVNDSVFYIHGNDVYAARWDDLSNISPAR